MHVKCAQDTWCIGLNPTVPGQTPANQCEEKWHKDIKEVLKGEMRGSTEAVLTCSIPKVFWKDGVKKPDTLLWEATHIPPAAVQKAWTYVEKRETMIKGTQHQVGDTAANMKTLYVAYVLRHKAAWDEIDELLIEMCVLCICLHLCCISLHFLASGTSLYGKGK